MEAPKQSSSRGPVACFWSANRKRFCGPLKSTGPIGNCLLRLMSNPVTGSNEINYLTRNRKLFLGQTRGFVQAKQKMPICAKLADHPRYYQSATTSVPLSSTSDNSQFITTSNIFPEASSEVRPFIPTDRVQNKGDDSEKGDNEEVQSNNESNRDRESEEDKDEPERFISQAIELYQIYSSMACDINRFND
ncbi:hypothetical protein NPIL_637511 [Nephila pilipes]|uniref:Uncharacterized protein n=1 Tax=Nephila pilipes TaxID=299642 RepID=A0A8X6N9Q7_NEPPI|nr:hypothetical protein NPIL_637511 [Nephila pilipes]